MWSRALPIAFALTGAACNREPEMRALAAKDFACPEASIHVLERRADIGEPTWEIEACGHHARYTCHVADRHARDPDRRHGVCKKDLEYPSATYTPDE